MPKYNYKIGPELDGHILNGEKLFAGVTISSAVPLSGAGFNLVESEVASISKPVPSFVKDSETNSAPKPKKAEHKAEE